MSRELIGFAIIALACILISPYYKGPVMQYAPKQQVVVIKEVKNIVKTTNKKTIILLSDSFLPTTFAVLPVESTKSI